MFQLPESDVKAKKPRAKPKVQEDVDIEALAKVNQVHFLTRFNKIAIQGTPQMAVD